jgi:hypothetical protein
VELEKMKQLSDLEKQVNDLIVCGKPLEAFELFYDDEVDMQENTSQATKGKEENRRRERRFYGAVSEVRATLLGSAVTDDMTFSEWDYDILLKNGARWKMIKTAVRRWKNGKIVHERFYHENFPAVLRLKALVYSWLHPSRVRGAMESVSSS